MTIKRTDEMERVMYAALAEQEPGRHHAALRKGLDAVLAIVERNLAGPCPASFHIGLLAVTQPKRCDLRAGHAGDHESGGTRWWEAEETS